MGYGSKRLFIPFMSARKDYGTKGILVRWVIVFFDQHAPRYQSSMILQYHGTGLVFFGYRKGFDRLETIASHDAYQATKY